MPLEVLARIEQLVRQGATVIGPKPSEVPGLQDHAARTMELRRLADEMWGPGAGAPTGEKRHGKGRVAWGTEPREWLASQSVGPDFTCEDAKKAPHLDYIHRRTAEADIYFVRNKSSDPVHADCLFRVHDRAPQFWDPTDGGMTPAFVNQTVEDGTRVRLDLPPGASLFVVFAGTPAPARIASLERTGGPEDASLPPAQVVAAGGTPTTVRCWRDGSYELKDANGTTKRFQVDKVPSPRVLAGPWTVAFDPAWGASAEVRLPELISWTEHADEGVKFYSGTGTYTRTIEVPGDWLAAKRRVFLDLGEVRELAEVFINGQSAGVLWKPPFRADVTPLVRSGANTLKIEVMNMWINRLSGDLELPPEKRLTRTNIKFDGYRPDPDSWQPQPSGLLGPVRLLATRDVVGR
jgi:hypothetical protein